MMIRSNVVALASLALLAACQPSKQSAAPKVETTETELAGPVIKAWTEAFSRKSMLFADEIVVDGPQGIIDRTALRIDPDTNDSTTRTTKDGLRQELRLKPGAPGELHAFLDNWELVGFQRIVILERVAPCDVHVRASGDARYVDLTTQAEQTGAELLFEGKIPR